MMSQHPQNKLLNFHKLTSSVDNRLVLFVIMDRIINMTVKWDLKGK